MNEATLTGNVGKDPEVRHLNDGTAVANFSLATTERWTTKDGEKKEATEWHRVVVWGDALVKNVIEKYVRKGTKLLVRGKIRTRQWEDQAGVTRYATEIVVQGGGLIELLGTSEARRNDPPPHDREPDGRGAGREAHHSAGSGETQAPPARFDDEIPF